MSKTNEEIKNALFNSYDSKEERLAKVRHVLCEAAQRGDEGGVESSLNAGFSVSELDKSPPDATSPLVLSLSARNSTVYLRLRFAGFMVPLGMVCGHYHFLQWMALWAPWKSADKKPEMNELYIKFPELRIHPIFLKATWGEIDIKELKNSQASIKDKQGNNILTYACANNHLQQVKDLVACNEKLTNETNQFNEAPINWAVNSGHIEIVKWLYNEAGASLDFINTEDLSAILSAAGNGREEILRFLLDRKIFKIDHRNKKGETPYIVAARHGHVNILMELYRRRGVDLNKQQDNKRKNALLKAAEFGQLDVAKWLVRCADADIFVEDCRGLSVLVWAVISGNLELVQWLLLFTKLDVNFSVLREGNVRPIHYAANRGFLSILQLLIKHGAENARDADDWTALHYAAELGHPDIVRYLLEEKFSDIQEVDKKKDDAIAHAVSRRQLPVIKYFFSDYLKDRETKEIEKLKGETLLKAAFAGALEIIKYLRLEMHAPLIADGNGMTALLLAASGGKSDTVKWLLTEGGANINDKNKKKRTVFQLAKSDSRVPEILKQFKDNAEINNFYSERRGKLQKLESEIHELISQSPDKDSLTLRFQKEFKSYESMVKVESDMFPLDGVFTVSFIKSNFDSSFVDLMRTLTALKKEITERISMSKKELSDRKKKKKPVVSKPVLVAENHAPSLAASNGPPTSPSQDADKKQEVIGKKRKDIKYLFELCLQIFAEVAPIFLECQRLGIDGSALDKLIEHSKKFTRAFSDSRIAELQKFSITFGQENWAEEIKKHQESFDAYIKNLDMGKLESLEVEIESIKKICNAEYGNIKKLKPKDSKASCFRKRNKSDAPNEEEKESDVSTSKGYPVSSESEPIEEKPFPKSLLPIPRPLTTCSYILWIPGHHPLENLRSAVGEIALELFEEERMVSLLIN